MQYMNLVFARHDANNFPYLFEAPRDMDIKKGTRLIVRTSKGLKEANATAASFVVPASVAKTIVENHGGYWPAASVVAIMKPEQKTVWDVTVIREQATLEEITSYMNEKENNENE